MTDLAFDWCARSPFAFSFSSFLFAFFFCIPLATSSMTVTPASSLVANARSLVVVNRQLTDFVRWACVCVCARACVVCVCVCFCATNTLCFVCTHAHMHTCTHAHARPAFALLLFHRMPKLRGRRACFQTRTSLCVWSPRCYKQEMRALGDKQHHNKGDGVVCVCVCGVWGGAAHATRPALHAHPTPTPSHLSLPPCYSTGSAVSCRLCCVGEARG